MIARAVDQPTAPAASAILGRRFSRVAERERWIRYRLRHLPGVGAIVQPSPPPAERTMRIPAEPRTVHIATEARIMRIAR